MNKGFVVGSVCRGVRSCIATFPVIRPIGEAGKT